MSHAPEKRELEDIDLVEDKYLYVQPYIVNNMCEFNVFLNNEKIFEGAVYAKASGTSITIKNILGSLKNIENVQIIEVDVTKEKLVLASL